MGRHHRHHIIFFNPAWCLKPPLPIKDTRPCPVDNILTTSTHPSSRPKTSTITVEPSSPKVGCMGQIKKCKGPPSSSGGRSVSSSSSSSSRSSPPSGGGRDSFFDLKRVFSGKRLKLGSNRVVSVANLDPPLPVVKRLPARDDDRVSLWMRRCGGDGPVNLQQLCPARIAA